MKKMFGRLGVVVMAAGVIVLMVSGTSLAKNPKAEVFVIGDSLSDPGNLFNLTTELSTPTSFLYPFALPPSPPYEYRYSNGKVWTEYFSADMGVPVDSRAYGGALSGVFNIGGNWEVSNFNSVQFAPSFPELPGVTEEINGLLADYPGGLNKDALYVIWAGANDFFLGLTLEQQGVENALSSTLAQTLGNIAGAVCQLGAAGAKHFAIGNMPDIGMTPEAKALGPGFQAALSDAADWYNSELVKALAGLPAPCAETMVILDTYEIIQAVHDKPELFNLPKYENDENVEEACLDWPGRPDPPLSICDSPDDYLFWDSVHPTTAGHAIFADEFRAAFCGTGADHPGLRGRPTGAPPAVWRGICYGTN